MLKWIAAAAGLALLASAAFGKDAPSAEFQVEEVPSLDAVPLDKLKPKTIEFADKPREDLVDPSTGFMRFSDWVKAKPVESQFLTLFPGYAEPNEDIIIDGVKKRFREKLYMYVASARFVLSKPTVDVASLATLPFIEKLDPQIKQRLASAEDPKLPREPKTVHNQNPQRRWCEGRPGALCIYSVYKFEGRLPTAIALANKIREGSKRIPDTLEFESEVAVLSQAEIADRGLTQLTKIDSPVIGGLEQSIFYVNQVMQFGKLLAVFQQYPNDPQKTVGTVYVALAIDGNVLNKRKDFAHIPVLRNMSPAQVLLGNSSFNTGDSLSAGLPVYARNRVKGIATILDKS